MPYALSKDGLCVHHENADKSLGKVITCHDTHAQATAHLRALYVNVPDASAHKSNMTRIDALLAGKMHQSFTVAADQLVQRGYVTQPQRIALSGLIGNMLDAFNSSIDPTVASAMVDPECADQIAMMKETQMTKLKESNTPIETFANWFNATFKAKTELKKDDEAAEDPKEEAAESPDKEKAEDDVEKDKPKPPMGAHASKEFCNEFSIFKQADETYRWIGVTSSGFRDRDKQLVTSDALKADVARMNKEQAFGELSWWHVMFQPENPPTLDPGRALDIASCDASEIIGASNIESGVFYDNAVGKALADAQGTLGFSREFFYPASEPDAQGNFNRIHTYRRTILPASRASNLMSAETLAITKETKEGKMSKLKELVGDEAYATTLARVAQKEKELERAGVEKKEQDAPDMSLYATKEEVAAIAKSLSGISEALTTFTNGYAASAQKERETLASQLKEISDKVGELYGDAPNFLKLAQKSAEHRNEDAQNSAAVAQAAKLAAQLKEAAGGVDMSAPLGAFSAFAMPDFSKNGH